MIKWILLILVGWMLPGTHVEPVEPEYIVIERDYGGTILLDTGTGIRYLRTDEGMHEIEEGL